jgi:hypothetical protein
MSKYRVSVEETVIHHYEIEADSEEHALQVFQNMDADELDEIGERTGGWDSPYDIVLLED